MTSLKRYVAVRTALGAVCVSLVLTALLAGSNWSDFLSIAPGVTAVVGLLSAMIGMDRYRVLVGKKPLLNQDKTTALDISMPSGSFNSHGNFVLPGGVDHEGRGQFE